MKKRKHKRPKLILIERPDETNSELKIVEKDNATASLKPLDQRPFMFDEVGIFLN